MSSTHSANPMACAVGAAVIEELEGRKLIFEAERKEDLLNSRLTKFQDSSKGRFCIGKRLNFRNYF